MKVKRPSRAVDPLDWQRHMPARNSRPKSEVHMVRRLETRVLLTTRTDAQREVSYSPRVTEDAA
jgi:hypothetical protein